MKLQIHKLYQHEHQSVPQADPRDVINGEALCSLLVSAGLVGFIAGLIFAALLI